MCEREGVCVCCERERECVLCVRERERRGVCESDMLVNSALLVDMLNYISVCVCVCV